MRRKIVPPSGVGAYYTNIIDHSKEGVCSASTHVWHVIKKPIINMAERTITKPVRECKECGKIKIGWFAQELKMFAKNLITPK